MVESKRVLTQEQIAAMLAREDRVQPESAEKPVNVTPTSMKEIRARGIGGVSSTSAPSVSNESPQTIIAQLLERLTKLEAAISQGGAGAPALPELMEQLQALSKKVDSVIANLEGTVGFGARRAFICKNCQSQGQVAARLHCTVCGGENWWGWWPQPRQ
jgi:hypothetical protein